MALSRKDREYYQGIIKEDEKEHQSKLIGKNMPDKVISAYEGLMNSENTGDSISEATFQQEVKQENIIENWLAIAADTIIPTLYHQVPMPNIRSRSNGSPYSAEILNGLMRHFFDEKAKIENQRAIMDAYLAYGFGVVKVGYNTRVGIAKKKRSNIFTGNVKAEGKNIDMESSDEYVKYERPFIERISPKDCILDWTKEFGKGQRVTFKYTRTLTELIGSNLYSLSQNFLTHFKSKSDDNRNVKLKLKEHWVMIDGFVHKLVLCDEWSEEEIAWAKTPYQWLPMSLLRFKNPSDTLYSRSHGSIATAGQEELNYENELWKEHIDTGQNLMFVDKKGLDEDGLKTLKTNPTHGIIYTNKPPGTVAQPVSTNPMSADIYSNIQNVRSYLQQVLSAGGSISGDVSAKLATQERNQQLGNALRTSGMQDAIRDFNIDQIRKMVTCLVNYGDPEVTVAITGKDVRDPQSGVLVTGKALVVGGETGLKLKEQIIGNVESDYKYDMDMSSAARPDFAVVRKQLMEYATALANMMPMLQGQGFKVNWSSIAKGIGKTFDTIPDAENIIEEMTPEEQQSFQQQQAQAEMQKTLQGASAPTEAAIVNGAERVNQGIPQQQ
uniref:Uncharacterized protein n=1 Tax=viral metagenome TaxID=1070528 RepID=A0A6M3J6V4_9ZZZZ